MSDEPDERDGAQSPPEPYFGSMIEWFERWLRPAYRRSTHGDLREWCEQWWRHGEALSRIDALWRAWEALRLDPGTGLSVWWRDHADHHLAVLLDADGPFKGCGDGHVDDSPELLRHTPPPPDMFASEQATVQPPSPVSGGSRRQDATVEASPHRHTEQRPTIDRRR